MQPSEDFIDEYMPEGFKLGPVQRLNESSDVLSALNQMGRIDDETHIIYFTGPIRIQPMSRKGSSSTTRVETTAILNHSANYSEACETHMARTLYIAGMNLEGQVIHNTELESDGEITANVFEKVTMNDLEMGGDGNEYVLRQNKKSFVALYVPLSTVATQYTLIPDA